MQVEGCMYNLTSQTATRKKSEKKIEPSKSKGPAHSLSDVETVDFEIIEILENGLTVEAALHSCSVGHHLSIEFWVKNAAEPVQVSGRAKVIEVEALDLEIQRIVMEFLKVDQTAWNKFCALYSGAQDKAMELFQSIRGY